jgi:hypothetical protein
MIVFYLFWFLFEVYLRTTSCHYISGTVANYSEPVLGIVTFQKDEEALLYYWLEYHSKIVKLQNIIILDNYSEDPKTLEILNSWVAKGLRVLFYQGPYTLKGMLTSQAFHQILPHVDVIVPLDVDEFLFAFDGNRPVISKRKILSTLNDFWNQKNYSCLGLQQYYHNANLHGNETLVNVDHFENEVLPLWYAKKIGKAREVVKYDQGNHYAYFPCPHGRSDDCQRTCISGMGHLGLLHYHYINPEYVARRAIAVSISRSYLPAGFTLEKAFANKEMIEQLANKTSPGHHKLKELWAYISEGPKAVLKTINGTFNVAPLPEIVRKIESS